MHDVARLAGVSHQTVSRVLNDHPHVREETRQRVLDAIDRLGYRPNSAAKTLVTGRSTVVGVVAQNSTLFGPSSLLFGLEQAADATDFLVSVTTLRSLTRGAVAEAVRRHLDHGVAGIVLITPLVTAADALRDIPGRMPLVLVDGDPTSGHTVVTVDQQAGARLATEHLLAAGHRTVWHVAGPADWLDAVGRVNGWREALRDAGAEVPELLQADWSAASGYRAGLRLAERAEVTAVFAANDHLALGILRAMHERGRSVPGDLSLVGFDDVPEAAFFSPPLTTVRPDFAEVGRRALGLLVDQIDSGACPGRQHVVLPELVARGSVGAPRR